MRHARPPSGLHPSRLVRRKNRELDAQFRQDFQSLQVGRRFRQPHSLGMAAEAFFKVANAPKNLRVFVLARRQGKDHVVVGLGHRRAMAGEKPLAFAVGRQDRFIHRRTLLLHPRKQGRAEVEADLANSC